MKWHPGPRSEGSLGEPSPETLGSAWTLSNVRIELAGWAPSGVWRELVSEGKSLTHSALGVMSREEKGHRFFRFPFLFICNLLTASHYLAEEPSVFGLVDYGGQKNCRQEKNGLEAEPSHKVCWCQGWERTRPGEEEQAASGEGGVA